MSQQEGITVPTAANPAPIPAATAAASEEEITSLVSAFEAHDFGSDKEFRAGLPAIIKATKGKGSSAAEIDEVIGRAQWFYFTRQKQQSPIPFETYLQYRTRETESQPMKSQSQSPAPAYTSTVGPAPHEATSATSAATAAEGRVAAATAVTGDLKGSGGTGSAEDMSFTDVVRLISEGRADEVPVPIIPDGIHEGVPSVSALSARPKPWEQAGEGEQSQVGAPAAS